MTTTSTAPSFVQRYAAALEGLFRHEGQNAWTGRVSLLSLEPLHLSGFTGDESGTATIECRAIFDGHTSSALVSRTAAIQMGVIKIALDIFHARAFDGTYSKKVTLTVSNAILQRFEREGFGEALDNRGFNHEREALIREQALLAEKMKLLFATRTNAALNAYASFENNLQDVR